MFITPCKRRLKLQDMASMFLLLTFLAFIYVKFERYQLETLRQSSGSFDLLLYRTRVGFTHCLPLEIFQLSTLLFSTLRQFLS